MIIEVGDLITLKGEVSTINGTTLSWLGLVTRVQEAKGEGESFSERLIHVQWCGDPTSTKESCDWESNLAIVSKAERHWTRKNQ